MNESLMSNQIIMKRATNFIKNNSTLSANAMLTLMDEMAITLDSDIIIQEIISIPSVVAKRKVMGLWDVNDKYEFKYVVKYKYKYKYKYIKDFPAFTPSIMEFTNEIKLTPALLANRLPNFVRK